MSNDITDPTLDSQARIEEVYEQAKAGFILLGDELYPWTPERKVAGQRMGMLYPFIGEQGQVQYEQTGRYAGDLMDMAIVLWLCSLKETLRLTAEEVKAKVWTPMRALRMAEPAMEVALAWATDKGLFDENSKEFQEGFQVYMAILSGVSAAEFVLEVEKVEASDPGGAIDTKV